MFSSTPVVAGYHSTETGREETYGHPFHTTARQMAISQECGLLPSVARCIGNST